MRGRASGFRDSIWASKCLTFFGTALIGSTGSPVFVDCTAVGPFAPLNGGAPAGEHVVPRAPERINLRAEIDDAMLELLRTLVMRRLVESGRGDIVPWKLRRAAHEMQHFHQGPFAFSRLTGNQH